MITEVKTNPANRTMQINSEITKEEMFQLTQYALMRSMEVVAERIADKFLEENMQKILSAMDPTAVANLAIAESANGIRQATLEHGKMVGDSIRSSGHMLASTLARKKMSLFDRPFSV